jgi:hypothetical protein
MATAYDSGDDESVFTRRRQRRKRNLMTFAYDVGVNLLANLLALTIGYLVAQAAGVIDPNSGLSKAAILMILATGGAAVGIFIEGNYGKRARDWWIVSFCLLGALLADRMFESARRNSFIEPFRQRVAERTYSPTDLIVPAAGPLLAIIVTILCIAKFRRYRPLIFAVAFAFTYGALQAFLVAAS